MDGIIGAFDSFRIEEAYNWRDDIMEITRLIVHETDEARLNNIAEHFEVDLSEIRELLEMKRKKMGKPQTNADRIRSMTDAGLAEFFQNTTFCDSCFIFKNECGTEKYSCKQRWLDWLKQEADNGEN